MLSDLSLSAQLTKGNISELCAHILQVFQTMSHGT